MKRISVIAIIFFSSLSLGIEDKCDPHYDGLSGEAPREGESPQLTTGRSLVDLALKVFNNPEKYLDPKDTELETTPLEDVLISNLALKFLLVKGASTANATHIQEHLDTIESPAVRAALEEAGISGLNLTRNILLHDLGKEFDQLPVEYQQLMNKVFPKPESGPDTNFLPRVIMGHEFASMLVTAQLAKEAGIDPKKVDRLNAMFAKHNAGYDPDLKGFHFWVQKFAWGNYAAKMREAGFDVPETYRAVPSTDQGGRNETVILTAVDRLVSLTLASQEKFAPALINGSKWNNAGLAGQFSSNAVGVPAEGANVLKKMKPGTAEERASLGKVKKAILGHFAPNVAQLKELSANLGDMATATGKYSDRPNTSAEELASSIVYRTKEGKWYRVSSTGEFYEGSEGGWKLNEERSKIGAGGPAVSALLFREVIFPDNNFTPATLQTPLALRKFTSR